MKIISGIWVPHPPPFDEGAGLAYAQALAAKTQGLSLVLTFLGWSFVVLGALLAIAASVLGSSYGNENSGFFDTIIAHRGLLCSTGAIVFAGVG